MNMSGPITTSVVAEPNVIALNDVYVAIQGEGCLAGVPMVLVRLHGCDVGCPFCDTKETWTYHDESRVSAINLAVGTNDRWVWVTPNELASYVHCRMIGPSWVMLTGGEPSQQRLGRFVEALKDRQYRVALETSGTATGCLGCEFDWVCVSPKIDMPGGKKINQEVMMIADEIKMVIGKEEDIRKLDELLHSYRVKPGVQVCLQPMSMSKTATELCSRVATQRGWRLSIQTHQLLGMR